MYPYDSVFEIFEQIIQHILFLGTSPRKRMQFLAALESSKRELTEMPYHNDFDGLSGNEDVGQMSAWYILSSMGIYQVEPSGGKYMFGSPLFDKAEVNVAHGKTFTILAHGNSPKNMYVSHIKLNGKLYNKLYIDYKDIMAGGTLEFFMTDRRP